jgi:hypothetical protein
MIASTSQIPQLSPVESARLPFVAALLRDRAAVMAFLLGFLSFLPYPAINVGSSTAIQMGNILVVVMLIPAIAIPWLRRPFVMVPLFFLTTLISTLRVAFFQQADLELALKNIIVWALSMIAITVTQLTAPGQGLMLLTGIAAATVLHVIVGIWQYFAFAAGTFPLLDLYVNQSFLSVQDNAEVIVRWIQRPFGLFPEPSAMASSLAPWIVLWTAEMCGLVRFRQTPRPWQRKLFAAASFGGLLLIILARTGHLGITAISVLICGVLWLWRSKATPRTFVLLLLIFGVALPLGAYMAAASMQDRIGDSAMGNSSWEERSSSLIIGFQIVGRSSIGAQLVGLGPGVSAPALWNTARIAAVFSVVLMYVYETGVLGVLAIAWGAHFMFQVWRASAYNIVYILMLIVWFVGILLTTSYGQLLPIWVALGWLTVWPAVCEHPQREPLIAAAGRRLPDVPHRSLWRITAGGAE